jgi:hypothetical protein
MKKLIACLLLGAMAACAAPRYTVYIYESGKQTLRLDVQGPLPDTMVVVRDNQTNNWSIIPGSDIQKRLDLPTSQPSTMPAK